MKTYCAASLICSMKTGYGFTEGGRAFSAVVSSVKASIAERKENQSFALRCGTRRAEKGKRQGTSKEALCRSTLALPQKVCETPFTPCCAWTLQSPCMTRVSAHQRLGSGALRRHTCEARVKFSLRSCRTSQTECNAEES